MSKKKKVAVTLLFVLLGLLATGIIAVLLLASGLFDSQVVAPVAPVETVVEEDELVIEQEEPSFNPIVLQATLDDWVEAQSGTASVVITDTDGVVLASHNDDQVYFAASIYKLYVAYEGYRGVEAGELNPDEDYINGNTLAECLDIMIRESDSPCAEKLWVQLGKETVNDILKTYGLTNTSMTLIRTSAADAAIMLARIARGQGLSEASQAAYLASMKDQIYRDALNAGFDDPSITVYNKIGFREQIEYHDTAFVELEDGRRLVVSVMTENVGTRQIAALGTALQEALLEDS